MVQNSITYSNISFLTILLGLRKVLNHSIKDNVRFFRSTLDLLSDAICIFKSFNSLLNSLFNARNAAFNSEMSFPISMHSTHVQASPAFDLMVRISEADILMQVWLNHFLHTLQISNLCSSTVTLQQ